MNTRLYVEIRGLIELKGFHILKTPDQHKLTILLTEHCEKTIDKFIAGQLEHGGDFDKVDRLHELKREIIDLCVYANWPME